MLKDPVCGQRVRRDRAHAHTEYEHVIYYVCCPRCQAEFEAAPERYARPEAGEKVGGRAANQATRMLHHRG